MKYVPNFARSTTAKFRTVLYYVCLECCCPLLQAKEAVVRNEEANVKPQRETSTPERADSGSSEKGADKLDSEPAVASPKAVPRAVPINLAFCGPPCAGLIVAAPTPAPPSPRSSQQQQQSPRGAPRPTWGVSKHTRTSECVDHDLGGAVGSPTSPGRQLGSLAPGALQCASVHLRSARLRASARCEVAGNEPSRKDGVSSFALRTGAFRPSLRPPVKPPAAPTRVLLPTRDSAAPLAPG